MRAVRNTKLDDQKIHSIVLGFINKKTAFDISRALDINRHSVERIFSLIRKSIETTATEASFLISPIVKKRKMARYPLIGISIPQEKEKVVYLRVVAYITEEEYEMILLDTEKIKTFVFYDYEDSGIRDRIITDPKLLVYTSEFGRNYAPRDYRSFVQYAKKFRKRYYGVSWDRFPSYMKEIEWQYNHRQLSNIEKTSIILSLLQSFTRPSSEK